ncbi:MAG: O-antigen ligase family protein [Verrucomicrobiota bacterium]|nr:O-antigen ligase family protein [Verrucomicrobiota bacterium]
MQPSEPAAPTRAGARSAAGWAAVAVPLLVVFAVFLGGATQRWSVAIVLGCFSLLLFARPPRYSLGPVLNTVAILFLALAATAFLPADWFLLPHWRTALTKDFGVQLASTVSAQPWVTADSLVVLVAGLTWIYYVATLDAQLRDIRMAARVYSGAIILLAAFCIYLHLGHRALPFWHNERGFGPFPNRNQTGDLFGISTLVVLGCMQDDFRRGHKRWLLWLAGVGILIAALVLAFSRAGILILVVGFTAWLVRFAFRKWSGAGVAIAASLLLVLFAGLLIFGGETIERFHLRLGSEGSVTSDYRWLIFRDAWSMIQASPWCGVGLANFESVFALFRDASEGVTRSLHPESDWLWVGTEMGWPALALLLVAGSVFVWRASPLREGTNQRLRYTALVGASLFALHGLVDVSAHRFGSFLAGTFLLGLAQFRPPAGPPRRWPVFFFRLVAVCLLAISLTWFFTWRRAWSVPGRLGVENTKQAATIANRGHRFGEAVALTNQALGWAPLDWQLYYLRAIARIGERQPAAEALADFRRARFLEPSAYQLPFEEGKAWLGWQPTLAITAWREALHRPGADEAGVYALMLTEAATRDSRVHEALRDYALERPALTIKYLEAASRAQFEATVQELLARDPSLGRFSREEKVQLFVLWSKQDPLDSLLRAVAAHPDWMEFAWPGVTRDHAERREFREAWEVVRQHAGQPTLPEVAAGESIAALEQKLAASPEDFAVGYALYRAQMEAGKTDDALATLRHFTALSDAPAYFYYLLAEGWAEKQNWERAWEAWQEYIVASGPRR